MSLSKHNSQAIMCASPEIANQQEVEAALM